jgi:hypothetical protein
MRERIARWLRDPRIIGWLAGLAVLLAAPSLWMWLCGDDFYHRLILLGRYEGVEPLSGLFTFLDGTILTARMEEAGVLSWWASENLRMAFFRPLSAATHVLDYALWPDRFWLHHAHSLLWFGAGVALVGRLYQRILPGMLAAGLAALLFAVEDAHAMSAAWIANRNALLTLCFGMVGLLAHIRWRREGRAGMALAAHAALGVGLLCGEATLGALAYIVAWQLTLDRGGLSARLRPLLGYAALTVVWRLYYDNAGYGAIGSGLYVDPGAQPLRFAVALAERWPILMLGQWLQAPIDLWPFLPRGGQLLMTALGVAATAAAGWLLAPLLRRHGEARFYAAGMGLSMVPLCAAFPMDRLLIFAGVGAAGLLGMLISEPGERRRPALLLAVLHIPVAAMLLVGRVAMMPFFAWIFAIGAELSPRDDALSDQTLIFLNGSDFAVSYTYLLRTLDPDAPCPRRLAAVSSFFVNNELYREDADSLVVTPEGGFLARSIDRLFRDVGEGFSAGQRIESPDFTVEVLSVMPDGRPASVRLDFPTPLEDPRLRWVRFGADGLVEVRPPAIGERVLLPAVLPGLR